MGKATMKDIARAAGVSVATVSYVLNNNEKEKIPDETREKILKIAEDMDYVPNLAARSLVKKKSYLIGILVVRDYKNETPWKKFCYSEFINILEQKFSKEGYHIIISNIDTSNPQLDIIAERELDGVFIINVRKDFFYTISNRFTVPIIIVDSLIDDIIFHKVLPDLEQCIKKSKDVLGKGEMFLITDVYNDESMMNCIKFSFGLGKNNICEAYSKEEVVNFAINHKGGKFIVINEFIALLIEEYINEEDMVVICTSGSSFMLKDGIKKFIISNEKKAEAAAVTMIDYINKNYYNYKYTYIQPESEN